MTWFVEICDTGKEAFVARARERQGRDAYLATTVISHPVTHKGPRKTKRRLVREIPLWPRHIFVNLQEEGDFEATRHSQGLRRTNGWAWRIPERQMLKFMMAVRDAVMEAREAHAKGLRKVRKKDEVVKLTSLEELGKYMERIIGGDIVDFETGEILSEAA